MNVEEIRDYCISKKGVTEGFPFGNDTLVFKVEGKMFLLMGLDSVPLQFNAKCDPALAIALREKHDCVKPGYHMNKSHWNTIVCDGSVAKKIIFGWIDHSYLQVVDTLPKKIQEALLHKKQ